MEDVAVEAEFTVIEGKRQASLGRDALLRSLSPNVRVNSLQEKNLFQKYKSRFEGLGKYTAPKKPALQLFTQIIASKDRYYLSTICVRA